MNLLVHAPLRIESCLFDQIRAVGQEARRIVGEDVVVQILGIGAADDRTCRDGKAVTERSGRAQEAFVGIETLAAVGVKPADLDARQETAVEFPLGLGPQLVQFVLDDRLLEEADLVPAARIGQQDVCRIGVIEQAVDGVGTVFGEGESQRVLRARTGTAGAGIAFIVDVAAVERRITVIDEEAEIVGHPELGVDARRPDFRFVAFGIGAQDRHDGRIGRAVGKNARTADGIDLGAGPRSDRGFGSAEDARILGVAVKSVDRDGDAVARFELQRACDRKPFEFAADRTLAGVIGREDHAVFGAGDLEPVGLEFAADEVGRVRLEGSADGPAQRAAGVLVDIGSEEAIAVRREIGVEAALVVHHVARGEVDLAVIEIERLDGPQVDRAGDTGCGETRIGGLVDNALPDQLGGELVEFDAAVVTRRHNFAAIQQREREVRAETADGDLLRAATDALRGDAREACERVGDREVRQLADIFCRDHFDDVRGFTLGFE